MGKVTPIAKIIGVTVLIYEIDQASRYLLMEGVLLNAFKNHLMKVKSNDMPKLLKKIKWNYFMSRGGHTPLCFVTTCDNGVFNGGYLCISQYFFSPYL